ncbi:MAG: efflux RND transporter permease subunit [Verrucomicrobiae bacterium]|nr:efflux RND transporter permease subunit [Verrucomicrobiae bacterium]NNJ43743.1 efflux RND transporter permease subunit [Akkermansiaceae bacterium]
MSPLQKHPFITWFATNPVVANILMISLLAAGVFTGLTVRKEGFPAFAAESVTVRVPIRGGTPEDVERGVAIKIEESIESVDGIDHVRSVSKDNIATITIQAKDGYAVEKLLDDVKIRVDAIPSLPEQAEKPVVTENKRNGNVLWVELFGEAPEAVRKEAARKLRDALLRESAISKIETFGSRDYEVSIEPSEEKLRFYQLTFDEVADAVSWNSFDLGGGVIRSARGDIALRARDQAYRKADFENIPVRTNPDGTRVLVKDVAQVRDAFVDQEFLNRFRGEPTVSLKITTEGNDDIIDAVNQARKVVGGYHDLPEGIQVASWLDGSVNIRDRLSLLGRNGLIGVLLVLGSLMVFLNLRLAFWVAVGIPVSLAGAVTLFPIPGLDLSVNVISAFGFLVVLGIVVDDAIVIGESIYSEKEKDDHAEEGDGPIRTTVRGVSKVVTPATFGVITTIAAFLPLTQVSGRLGNVFGQIATTVIFCLIFSLIESKLILPSHLAHLNVHKKPRNPVTRLWARFQKAVANGLKWLIYAIYRPMIRVCITWRYAVVGAFMGVFILVIGLFPAGQLRFVFFPNIYRDNISVNLELEQGQSVQYLHNHAERIARTARQLGEKYEQEHGHNPFLELQVSASTNTQVSVVTELTRSTTREFLTTADIIKDWREAIGPIAGARALSVAARAGPPGGDLVVNLESENLEDLKLAADEMKQVLATYQGVYDILDTFDSGKPEILYSITPEGQAAGLTKRDLAHNVRNAFYGREAQRVQRGRDEVRVMVRYPLDQRSSIETLREMRVRKEDGTIAPFDTVADTRYSESLASIERYDNKRVVGVEASVDKSITSPDEVLQRLQKEFFPRMRARFPEISVSQSGEAEQRAKSMKSLVVGFLFSIIFIYILIAIALKSYAKPLVIMSVIPFGVIGALLGHYLMGIPVSILSVFGILALSGVVVNDSLVLVCRVDDLRAEGASLLEACRQAGSDRFRAILLTSLTTFLGLAPLLLETEVQAQFLKPMASSLAFGILFATLITLVLLPALMVIAKEVKDGLRDLYNIPHGD